MKKSLKILIALLALALCLSLLPALAADTQSVKSGDLSIPEHSRQDIALYRAQALSGSYSAYYAAEPSVSVPYSPGQLNDDYMDCGLGYLNYVRYAAGLSSVSLNSQWTTEAQYAAVVMAANNKLSHYPTQPEGMDAGFYRLGYNGASTSNIFCAYGYGNRNYLSFSVQSYMDDEDPSNMSRLGHRRWLLNPLNGMCVGFGQAKAASGYTYSATRVSGSGQTGTRATYRYVAWPASGAFPNELLATNVPWSVTLNPLHYDTGNLSNVQVSITRLSDGKSWTLSNGDYSSYADNSKPYFNIDRGGYGVSNCIIFHPGSDSWGVGTLEGEYSVNISGLYDNTGAESPLSYTVDFFDVEAYELPGCNVSIVSNQYGKLSIAPGKHTAGLDLSFSLIPNEGCKAIALIVDGVSMPIQDSYNLGPLSKDVSICALFAPEDTGLMEHEGLLYSYSDGGLTVMGHKHTNFSGEISVPDTVWGLTVNAVGDSAFESSQAGSITLPDTIRSIGEKAFYGSLHQGSFTIPCGVETIGTYAFSYMYGVTEFVLEGTNTSYAAIDGVLFKLENGRPVTLLNYAPASPKREYTVPDSVTLLYCTSFASARYLEELYVMSSSVRAMTYTFYSTDFEVYTHSYTRLWSQLSQGLLSSENPAFDIDALPPLDIVPDENGKMRLRLINTGSSNIEGSIFAVSYAEDGRMTDCAQFAAAVPACSVGFTDTELSPSSGSLGLFLLGGENHSALLPATFKSFQ